MQTEDLQIIENGVKLHPETNTSNVYDYENNQWLSETLALAGTENTQQQILEGVQDIQSQFPIPIPTSSGFNPMDKDYILRTAALSPSANAGVTTESFSFTGECFITEMKLIASSSWSQFFITIDGVGHYLDTNTTLGVVPTYPFQAGAFSFGSATAGYYVSLSNIPVKESFKISVRNKNTGTVTLSHQYVIGMLV